MEKPLDPDLAKHAGRLSLETSANLLPVQKSSPGPTAPAEEDRQIAAERDRQFAQESSGEPPAEHRLARVPHADYPREARAPRHSIASGKTDFREDLLSERSRGALAYRRAGARVHSDA